MADFLGFRSPCFPYAQSELTTRCSLAVAFDSLVTPTSPLEDLCLTIWWSIWSNPEDWTRHCPHVSAENCFHLIRRKNYLFDDLIETSTSGSANSAFSLLRLYFSVFSLFVF